MHEMSHIASQHLRIVTMYRNQRTLYHKILRKLGCDDDLVCTSVDGSQDDQKSYVILDLVTPGDAKSPMGFLKDIRRTNAALSRAGHGLMVIGNATMTRRQEPTNVIKAWTKMLKILEDWEAIQPIDVPANGHIDPLIKCPGPGYKAYSRQGNGEMESAWKKCFIL